MLYPDLAAFVSDVGRWLAIPWFTLGDAPISAGSLIGLVLILVAVWRLAAFAETSIRHVALRRPGQENSISAVYTWTRVLRYVVWIIGSLVGLNFIGVNLTSIALVGGVVGVGIGFGLQNIVNNFVSGIIILFERTLKVSDFVDLQSGVRGQVREIGLRYTRVTTNDDVDVIVPNSEFINGRVTNWTFENRVRRMRIPFGVAYGSNKEDVKTAGLRAALRVEGTVLEKGREPEVWLVGFGDNSLNFELVVWVGPTLISRPGRTEAAYLWAIEDELRAQRIEVPFPQRDLHVRSGVLDVRITDGEAKPAC
jgi:small-conductance mechanosensitive channel